MHSSRATTDDSTFLAYLVSSAASAAASFTKVEPFVVPPDPPPKLSATLVHPKKEQPCVNTTMGSPTKATISTIPTKKPLTTGSTSTTTVVTTTTSPREEQQQQHSNGNSNSTTMSSSYGRTATHTKPKPNKLKKKSGAAPGGSNQPKKVTYVQYDPDMLDQLLTHPSSQLVKLNMKVCSNHNTVRLLKSHHPVNNPCFLGYS